MPAVDFSRMSPTTFTSRLTVEPGWTSRSLSGFAAAAARRTGSSGRLTETSTGLPEACPRAATYQYRPAYVVPCGAGWPFSAS